MTGHFFWMAPLTHYVLIHILYFSVFYTVTTVALSHCNLTVVMMIVDTTANLRTVNCGTRCVYAEGV